MKYNYNKNNTMRNPTLTGNLVFWSAKSHQPYLGHKFHSIPLDHFLTIAKHVVNSGLPLRPSAHQGSW